MIAVSLRLTFFHLNWRVTPHTVRCNLKILIIAASLCLTFFFLSELAGDTPHTVRCNLEILITAASFFTSELTRNTLHTNNYVLSARFARWHVSTFKRVFAFPF